MFCMVVSGANQLERSKAIFSAVDGGQPGNCSSAGTTMTLPGVVSDERCALFP